ncbi:O-fucosyltransferase family protein [Forsythia ovata]|uniref:O-fucosyltransferase family protein n=1 Tax=Forsythia ovata TaxID=205694 RepID=A0ABD1USG0_9LAMI
MGESTPTESFHGSKEELALVKVPFMHFLLENSSWGGRIFKKRWELVKVEPALRELQILKISIGSVSMLHLSCKKLVAVRVPNRVSEDFITSAIESIFRAKRNLRLVTYFDSLPLVNAKETKYFNSYQCLATFECLKLEAELQELIDSMVGTLRSLSQKTHDHFLAVDLSVDILGKKGLKNATASKQCNNAKEIGEFLKNIGFETNSMIYLTHSGWHRSLDALRNTFPKTFTKNVIMPADVKGKFMVSEGPKYEKFIYFYICSERVVYVPSYPTRF